jgi:hypothetical protein
LQFGGPGTAAAVRFIVDYSTTDANASSVDNVLTPNNWYFIAVTFDGVLAPKIYIGTLARPASEIAYRSVPAAPTGTRVTDGGAIFAVGSQSNATQGPGGRCAGVNFITGAALSPAQIVMQQFQLWPHPMSRVLSIYGNNGLGPQWDFSGAGNNGSVLASALAEPLPPMVATVPAVAAALLGLPSTGINFDFTTGALPTAVTFTRASTGTYINSGGILATAGVNVARFNWPGGGTPCLLIEPSATNIVTQSNGFNNGAAWFTTNSPVLTPGAFVSPDGTANGWSLSSGSGFGNVGNYTTVYTAAQYTISCWVKRITGAAPHLFKKGAAAWGTDIPTTTVMTRVSATMTVGAGTDDTLLQVDDTSGKTNGIFGAQVELGPRATSYIPTTTAPVTRSADVATFTIPAGVSSLTYTFDDGSTQTVSVTPGSYTIPTNLNRPNIRFIVGATVVSNNVTLTPAARALALSPAAPALGLAVVVKPAARALALTGVAPTLRVTLKPTARALAITAAAPTLRTTVKPTVRVLALTGTAPALQTTVKPTARVLALTGVAPALRSIVRPAARALVLTGAPAIIGGGPAPAKATLKLTGVAPALKLVIRPAATVLAIAPALAIVRVVLAARPAVRALTLTPGAPVVRIAIPLGVQPIVTIA